MNPPECLLKISGIDKTFPGVKALTQASLSVYAGQAMALIGENGAGKSTLIKILAGVRASRNRRAAASSIKS